jgi:geranylgeranyl diphosphate synthase type I
VHVDFARRAREDFGYDDETAAHYGLALAILAGDIQQAWAASLMTDLYTTYGRSPVLALNLINELFRHVQTTLVNGETLDIVLSRTPLDQVTDAQILEMLRQKTGVLYEFAGRAGAAIGLDQADLRDPLVDAVANFTGKVGVAFQVQDDVLAITGETAKLGKKVGNDVREGKRTLVVTGSLRNMDASQRRLMTGTLGREDASDDEIQAVIQLMKDCGGVDYARDVARKATDEAFKYLDRLPDTPYRALLHDWADYLINREL